MDVLSENLRSLRARALVFELPDGKRVRITPPNLGQVAACVQLDPRPGTKETAAERVVRFEDQARILLGPAHEYLIDQLGQRQIAEITGALYAAQDGMTLENFVAWQKARLSAEEMADSLEILAGIEALVMDLAAREKKTPQEIERMTRAEALALQERLAKYERAGFEVQAIIAGTKLTWGGTDE